MTRARWIPILILALLVVLPDALHACPVCFDANDENRRAFFVTAAFMSALPFGLMGSIGWWIRKRARQLDEEMGPVEDDGRPEA
ncbi:MAG: hypothetical protein R3E10_09010 [Gemmatimonadota bacterium]